MFDPSGGYGEAPCEPGPSPEPLCFLLGRDLDGHWIVQEAHGLCGGLFTSETAATRYAKFEAADHGAIFQHVSAPIALTCSSR
jgi:hypothetical protein